MPTVSKLHAAIRLTLNERTDSASLAFEFDAPTRLEDLDAVPEAIASELRKRLAMMKPGAPASPVTTTAPEGVTLSVNGALGSAQAAEEILGALAGPRGPAPEAPRRRRSQPAE